MSDVVINTKQLESLTKRLVKASQSQNNPVQKQQKIVLNKINAERVKNIRNAIKPFTYTGRLAKSVKRGSAYVAKDKKTVKGRVYFGYQEYYGGATKKTKRGRYNSKGNLVYAVSAQKGEYYAHIPEYGRRDGSYAGRHFLWSSEQGINDIKEYKEALEKAVEEILLY